MQCFRRLMCLFVLFLAITVNASEHVRVRLFEKYSGFTIGGEIFISAGEKIFRGSRLILDPAPDSYSWSLEGGAKKISGTSDFSQNLIIDGNSLEYNGLKLPKVLKIVPVLQNNGKFSRFQIIALLELEQYLSGVLPAEMPLKWPLEALKAQAITARTYTLKQIENRKLENYDVDSTVRDQLFAFDTNLSDERRKNLNTALEETRGMILTDKKGEPVLANYHADCGGQTELPKNVWNFGSRGVAVNDEACALRPTGEWKYSISMEQLTQKLRAEISPKVGSVIASITPVGTTTGGRVSTLKLLLDDGTSSEILATRFRELIGYGIFKSTRFSIKHTDNELVFEGRGFGHGVGMCQWGAKELARAGKSFSEILNHYFPGIKVVKKLEASTSQALSL